MGIFDGFTGGAAPNPDDTSRLPYNADPQLAAMRQDIVDRSYRLTVTRNVISIATAGIGVGMMLLVGGPMGMIAGGALALGGPLVTTLITQREQERLRIDQEFLETRMQGGNWGHGHWQGYREEVAERGHGLSPALALAGAPSRRPGGGGLGGRQPA